MCTEHRIATKLLAAGAKFNRLDRKHVAPLSLACLHNQLAVAGVLLKWRADVNGAAPFAHSHTPLMIACSRGHHDLVALVRRTGLRRHIPLTQLPRRHVSHAHTLCTHTHTHTTVDQAWRGLEARAERAQGGHARDGVCFCDAEAGARRRARCTRARTLSRASAQAPSPEPQALSLSPRETAFNPGRDPGSTLTPAFSPPRPPPLLPTRTPGLTPEQARAA